MLSRSNDKVLFSASCRKARFLSSRGTPQRRGKREDLLLTPQPVPLVGGMLGSLSCLIWIFFHSPQRDLLFRRPSHPRSVGLRSSLIGSYKLAPVRMILVLESFHFLSPMTSLSTRPGLGYLYLPPVDGGAGLLIVVRPLLEIGRSAAFLGRRRTASHWLPFSSPHSQFA